MSRTSVVDTAVLFGALNLRDREHERAAAILTAADEGVIAPLVLTDFILAETLNFLTRKGGSAVAREALQRFEASRGLRIERISDDAFDLGKNEIFGKVDGLSFVNALTVAFMRARKIDRIYSFDADLDRVPKLKRLTTVA